MSTKKLTKTEIMALSEVIIEEANEIIANNNTVIKNSKGYLRELQLIKDANPFTKLNKDIEKLITSQFGKNINSAEVDYNTYGSLYHKHRNSERDSIEELNKKYNIKPHLIPMRIIKSIQNELILSQIDSKSYQLVKTSIINKLV